MNILVIGNGFDLAHGLETKYENFLDILQIIKTVDKFPNWETTPKFKEINKSFKNTLNKRIKKVKKTDKFKTLCELAEKNFWIKHMEQKRREIGVNWIDFESEISTFIQMLENDDKNLKKLISNSNKEIQLNEKDSEVIKRKKCISFLEEQLNNLIRSLEIYLDIFINDKESEIKELFKSLNIDRVLSFNYTNTYKRIYDKNNKIKYDYIHGKIREKDLKEANNMVLGIDEYLVGDEKNENLEMIYFKKYFQRIYKKTGNEYSKWIEMHNEGIKQRGQSMNNCKGAMMSGECDEDKVLDNIYFVGHSLDVTDKDILNNLFNVSEAKVIIFYCSPKDYRDKITNLVKVIGQDKLIEKTGGSNPAIIFVDQDEELDNLIEKGIIEEISPKEVVNN